MDIYKSPIIEDEKVVYKTTIVQGLTNSAHTLEIVPIGDGLVPIEAIEVHQPPLKYSQYVFSSFNRETFGIVL